MRTGISFSFLPVGSSLNAAVFRPTGFEFRHQPFDLLAASPLPNVNLSDFRDADSASKSRPVRKVVCSDGYGLTAGPHFCHSAPVENNSSQ
jgi:hypothetical protein